MPNYFMHAIDHGWIYSWQGPSVLHGWWRPQCLPVHYLAWSPRPSPKGGRSAPRHHGHKRPLFYTGVLWLAKIGSASALSGFPLRFVKQRRQHRRSLMITPSPTDAMGDCSLLFVLPFLGRQKFGSASALSYFPLEIFPPRPNQTTPTTLDDHAFHGPCGG
jgi:hypothetical protein